MLVAISFGFAVILIIALFREKFGVDSILYIINDYSKLVLTSWPSVVLILGIYTLTRHHEAIDYFIKNRMTEVGPGGLKGGLEIKEATEEEIKDKTILETVKDEEETKILGQQTSENIQIEPGVARPLSPITKEFEAGRFVKVQRIETLVQHRLKEKYQDRYKASVRISNGERRTIVDGLIYSKKGNIQSAVEIKFITSKNFDVIKWIIARKLRQLLQIGIKRLVLVLVSDSFTQEDVVKIYNDNVHQAQIYFYNLEGWNLIEVEVPERDKHIF